MKLLMRSLFGLPLIFAISIFDIEAAYHTNSVPQIDASCGSQTNAIPQVPESLEFLKQQLPSALLDDGHTRMLIMGLLRVYSASPSDKAEVLEILKSTYSNGGLDIRKFILDESRELGADAQVFFDMAKKDSAVEVLISATRLGNFLNREFSANNDVLAVISLALKKLPTLSKNSRSFDLVESLNNSPSKAKQFMGSVVSIVAPGQPALYSDATVRSHINTLLGLALQEGEPGRALVNEAKSSSWPPLKMQAILISQP